MDHRQTLELLKGYSTADPGYNLWREKMLDAYAPMDEKAQQTYWAAVVESAARTLADTDLEDAQHVIHEIERREISPPKYYELGDLSRFLASHAAQVRREREQRRRDQQQRNDERRVECPICDGRGMVTIWHPHFVREFQQTFHQYQREGFPVGWVGKAMRWWRKQKRGAMHHVAVCSCDCKAAEHFRQQQSKWEAHERKSPPACGMAQYRPDSTPLLSCDAERDLHLFYESLQQEEEALFA